MVALAVAAGVPAMGQLCNSWQVVAGNPGFQLADVTWAAEHWVAVGWAGSILTSTDGASWQRVAPLGPEYVYAVTWGAPGFLALGNDHNESDGTSVILTSSDGAHWTRHDSPPDTHLGAAAWGAGEYVSISGSGFFASRDGLAWTATRAPEPGVWVSKPIFDGARFVAVGFLSAEGGDPVEGYVFTSSDGLAWERRTVAAATALNSVAWNGTRYVAAGRIGPVSGRAGVFLASDDLGEWQQVAGPLAREPVAIAATAAGFVAVGPFMLAWTSPDGHAWTEPQEGSYGPSSGVATDGVQFVAVGYSDAIASSTDGRSWVQRSPVTFPRLADVVWTGRRYVAVGDGGAVTLSDDGGQWQALAPITTGDLVRVVSTGAKVEALTATGSVLESTDGRAWAWRPAFRVPSRDVAYGNGSFVAINDTHLERSRDLVTWETVSSPDYRVNKIAWTGTHFVAAATLSDQLVGTLLSSTDGLAWHDVGGGSMLRYGAGALAGNASTVVGADNAGGVFACRGDGSQCRDAAPGPYHLAPVAWAGSRFVAWSPSGFYASWDGVEWASQELIAVSSPTAFAGAGGTAVGVGTCIMRSTCPGSGEPMYLPGAAHNLGANSTQWRTDAFVANLGQTQARFTLELLYRSRENVTPPSTTFTLAPGTMTTYPDVVGSVFSFEGAGTLRVTPTAGEVTASERVYQTSGPASFGQHVAGLAEHAALGPGQRASLIGLSQSASEASGARTNIGLVNASAVRTVVTVELYRADGTLLGTRTYTLRPFESIQQVKLFAQVTSDAVPAGYAIVSTPTAGARFFAYAFLVDNVTGAPELVFPQSP
jgi:hypothetical protein